MELDDLKQTWQSANNLKIFKNKNIMELIQQKSYGPIAALKREFRRQIILMAVLPLCIFLTNVDDVHKVLMNVMFWSYIVFCAGVCVFTYYNYLLVKKMEGMDGMVKSTIEQQVELLERRLKWHIASLRIVLLFFILLCEVLPYFQHIRMLDKWHSLSPVIRFGAYAAFMILQYFISRSVCYRKFGQHLAYLKKTCKTNSIRFDRSRAPISLIDGIFFSLHNPDIRIRFSILFRIATSRYSATRTFPGIPLPFFSRGSWHLPESIDSHPGLRKLCSEVIQVLFSKEVKLKTQNK